MGWHERRRSDSLTPSGDGTGLRIVHDEVDDETAAMYRAGWESCLTRLPAYLAAMPTAGNR
jgi:hypothetical protein